jgi:HEAT repeat protein
MIFVAPNSAQAKDDISTGQNMSATNAKKASPSNIHVDDIVIKVTPDAQPENLAISEKNQKLIALQLSNDAQKEFLSWIDREAWIIKTFGFVVIIAVIGFIWAFLSRAIEKAIDKHVASLEDKKAATIEATIKANHEIEQVQDRLKTLQDVENNLEKTQGDFQRKIDIEIKKQEEELVVFRAKADSIDVDLKSKTEAVELEAKDEISRLEQKIKALEQIINKIDEDGIAKGRVIDELIANLKNDDKETRYTAAELLPQFKLHSSKVAEAFVETLKNNSDATFGSILLSGLGELGGDGKTLEYLVALVENISSNPNILAIIGALGELGETEIGPNLESIVDNLLTILNGDLDGQTFSDDTITASRVRGAIALALSHCGDKAEKSVEGLIAVLNDQDQETRKNAAIALGAIGVKARAAIPALQNLKDDEFTEVREAASEAIEKIQQMA